MIADPFLPEHRDNPYPAYASLRAIAPIVRHDRFGFFMATTAESVRAVLGDPDAFSSAKGIGPTRNDVVHRPTMLTRDPPDHTRLRSLVSRAFTPRRIAGLEPRILQIIDGLLDAGLSRGRFDIAQDFAHALPTAVLADLLGIEPDRLADLTRWSDDIITSLAGLGRHDRERTKRSYLEFDAFFAKQVEQCRKERRTDLLGDLVAAHDEHAALCTSEILSFCMLLFVAGTDTTTNLITNAVLALVEHPEQESKLRDDSSLAAGAVEETLRYDCPVQGIFRTTRREVELFGVTIGADQKVCALIGAANRDPRAFDDPDRFDIERSPNAHVAFGHGIHYCLGAPLARLEAKVALTQLVRRVKQIRPDPEGGAKRTETPMVRGLERYPVLLTPA